MSSKPEPVVARYAPYVEELQEFFSLRHVQCGYPENIFALAERLSSGGFFREEMSSMMRAIIYREREGITRDELLELVAIASGGPALRLASNTYEEPREAILEFLSRVIHSLWGSVPDEIRDADTIELSAHTSQPLESVPSPRPIAVSSPRPVPVDIEHHRISSAPEPSPESSASLPLKDAIFSHSLATSPEQTEPSPSILRPLLWVVAVCAVLLAIFPGVLFGHKSARQTSQAPSEAQATPAASLSVYGPSPMSVPVGNLPPPDAESPTSADDLQQPATSFPATTPDLPAKTDARSARHSQRQSGGPAYALSTDTPSAPTGPEPRASGSELAETYTPSHGYRHNEQGVFFVSSGLMTDNLLSAPAPDYPRLARLAHIEGPVILQVVVGPDGAVSATRVLRGDWLLRSAAEHAIRRWLYRPYRINGRSTDISTIVTVDFRLHH